MRSRTLLRTLALVLVADAVPGQNCLSRESVDSASGEANEASSGAYISTDGGWVAYTSVANDLVPGDTNGVPDVFLRHRMTFTNFRCSVGIAGQANGPSEFASVSEGGRFVAFASYASNLVAGDGNGAPDVFVYDRLGGCARVSVSTAGIEGDGPSYSPPWGGPSISPDGRYVAFCSEASNLVPDDTNGAWDVFVHDRDLDGDGVYDEHVAGGIRTWRASVSTFGVEGDGDSGVYGLWLSAHGRYVAFQSLAGTLIPMDLNFSDIYVHANFAGDTVLASLDTAGAQAMGFHYLPSISADLSLAADGRFVTWASSSSTIVPEDGNGFDDVFLRDLSFNVTSRVSVGTGGVEADSLSTRSMIDGTGRYVVFDSSASNLHAADGNFMPDVYERDLETGETNLISRPSGAGVSEWPTISTGIQYVAFTSSSGVLVPEDTIGGASDVFVRDCGASSIRPFCAPGMGGTLACPCGNPQVPAGATRGCNNFAGGGTGGALLFGSGAASIAADSVWFGLHQGIGTNVTILFQGPSPSLTGIRMGAGVRCVVGSLKRLYQGPQVAGAITFPNNGVPVHVASAARGFPILPPITLYYLCSYRNSAANGQPGCPGLFFGFNTSNGASVSWTP